MKTSILAIGDEVIIGKTVNTNAAYLAKELDLLGFELMRHATCRDDQLSITNTLDYLFQASNLVITIGGLGPTADDLTKEAIAAYFGVPLSFYPQQLETIEGYFKRTGSRMPPTNRKQAYFIEGSLILPNGNGTAPGMIYEQEAKTIVVLPGPPHELIPMFRKEVYPYLLGMKHSDHEVKTYRLMDIGESAMEDLIGDFYERYAVLKIAPYASIGQIDVQ